jgi:amino acid permease
VVLVNGWLISAKMLILMTAIVALLVSCPSLDLLHRPSNATPEDIYAMTSMAVCAFCCHMVIPSLRIYAGDNRRTLQYSIVGGMTLVFLVYVVWLMAVLGTVPLEVMADMHSVQGLIQAMKRFSESRAAFLLTTFFSQITMWVSFVAVSLSLFDTLMDFLRRPDTIKGRMQTALVTFVPPTAFVTFIPDGFLLALKYTAVFGVVILMVLPCIMAWRIRSLP